VPKFEPAQHDRSRAGLAVLFDVAQAQRSSRHKDTLVARLDGSVVFRPAVRLFVMFVHRL
jgi:hypothetical protein